MMPPPTSPGVPGPAGSRAPRLALLILLTSLAPPPAAALLVPNQVGSYGADVLGYPANLAIRPNGETYVVSYFSRRVDKFSRAGTHLLGWGSHGTGPGEFEYPYGVAVDAAGDVYVLDVGLNRVQKFSGAGTFLAGFGSLGSGPGQFSYPRAIAIGPSGDLYVADTFNHRVQKLDATGAYLLEWGVEGGGDGQFSLPYGIAVDAAGDVYVADTYNHRVQKFDASGAYLRQWGSPGTGDGQFAYPMAIHVDGGGNVYVADVNNHRVQRFTSTGVFVSVWGAQGTDPGQFVFPQGVAVGRGGDVHVCDTNNSRVQVFRVREGMGHEALYTRGTNGSGNAEFLDARGVAVGPDGFVYVADHTANRVQKFTSIGAWAHAWGTSGFAAGEFSGANGVAVDAGGSVYVTDEGNSRVQKFTSAGAFVLQWGTPGSGLGQFNEVGDVAVGGAGDLYVVDQDRVQKFDAAGGITGVWSCPNAAGIGTDGEGFVYVACTAQSVVRKYRPDGTLVLEWGSFGSNPGQFDGPTDVVADTLGYVYVCDGANRIQKFTPLGGYVTEWGEPGTGRRQLDGPQRLATDAAGSVYVTELGNHRFQKFASPPEILEIADVPGDEGGWARITFTRSSADDPGSGGQPYEYRIQRLEMSPPALVTVANPPLDGVTTTAVVSTAGNATGVYTGIKEYRVVALLLVPEAHPLIGWSFGFAVDNLAPPEPSPFTAAYESGATALHWGESPATDLSEFRLYRGEAADFAVSPASWIHATADTGYADVGPAGRYYKLVAADTSGNVSPAASLGPQETVAVPGPGAPRGLRLEEIRPNPARAADLEVRFVLPDARPARLELVSVAGRALWSREVTGAGPHALRAAAGRDLAAGIYFVRLTHAGRSVARRVAVLD